MGGFRVLVVGSGGREHALAWSLARSAGVELVFLAPGNAGTEWAPVSANGRRGGSARLLAPAKNVSIGASDLPALVAFAQRHRVDLTVVGPEAPLAAGIVDAFQSAGLRVFGPTREAARLESSKAFAKAFMREHAIPTADYAVFDDYNAARRFLVRFGRPVVVKVDGLAAGKGVFVCASVDEAEAALRRVLVEREFGPSGATVIIEERLSGREVSLLAFTDGRTLVPMPPARDHKRVYDGDRGPNTGGMGAYAPAPDVDAALVDRICRRILQPVVGGMAARGTPYTGVLYAGLMLTPGGPRVLEFNCRFGDPETQALLPLLATEGERAGASLLDIFMACTDRCLDRVAVRWQPGACATVVLAAPGYPGRYPTALPISGVDDAGEDVIVFHSGTVRQGGDLVTAGGRVLSVSAVGADLPGALARAYTAAGRIHFEGVHYRRDIGRGDA